jgi:hypothetical protein
MLTRLHDHGKQGCTHACSLALGATWDSHIIVQSTAKVTAENLRWRHFNTFMGGTVRPETTKKLSVQYLENKKWES